MFRVSFLSITLLSASLIAGQDSFCTSPTNTFTVKVNLVESDIAGFESGASGYYYFEECGNVTNPTIGIEIGQTYTFDQSDVSNYYHPMGFAYFPEGAHLENNELEPAVTEGSSDCASTSSCPAPMYFIDDEYLGAYSNIPEIKNVTTGEVDFGLDKYEPVFFYPLNQWAENLPYSIKLRFDDDSYELDLFYFCHIHTGMSARIKLLRNGVAINDELVPPLGIDYEYSPASDFDKQCGTFGLGEYVLPQPQCPETFVCDTSQKSASVQDYSKCLDAMNCAMFSGMTTSAATDDAVALFIHQMVPHHENAINMAKALLKLDLTPCEDFTADTPECMMNRLLREIINNQNDQIMQMNGILERKSVALRPGGCTLATQGSNNEAIGQRWLRK